MKTKLALGVALLAVLVLSFLHLRQLAALQALSEALAAAVANQSNLESELEVLRAAALDPAEIERLKADQADAIRLCGQVGQLKQAASTAASEALAAQKRIAAQPAPATVQQNIPIAENPYARVIGRKVVANLGEGHALVFGGWEGSPGKQTFAVAIPRRDENNADAIMIETKWIEIAHEAMSKLDTGLLLRAAGQQATMTPEQLHAFLTAVDGTPGVSILASPRVTVGAGRQASVSVTESRGTPNGPVLYGPVMNMTPTLGADGATIDLAVDATLTLPTQPAAEQ